MEFGAASYCIECNATPIIAVRRRFQSVPFVLKLHLEPIPDSEAVEIIDTLKGEVRAIEENQKDPCGTKPPWLWARPLPGEK